MLTKLSIQNYALINDVSISFSKGFTTITGETGAGKSILLGGLGLVLGNRADSQALMNPDKKCIIEAEFDIGDYALTSFFETHDLDYDALTIIRRELLPNGKSRAFVNDTPVRLNLLADLHNRLIDIHSQHQTLELNNTKFQFRLVDLLAGTQTLLQEYAKALQDYHQLGTELDALTQQIQLEKNQFDYHSFLLDELEQADFKIGEQETLELLLEQYNNSEFIQQNLSEAYGSLSHEELGLTNSLHRVKSNLEKIQSFSKNYMDLYRRLESMYIDIKDIETELEDATESLVNEPGELTRVNNRLQLLYDLFQKHHVQNIEELLQFKEELATKVLQVTDADRLLKEKKEQLSAQKNKLLDLAKKISSKRKSILPNLENQLVEILKELGMPDAKFHIQINSSETFYALGIDEMQWLFSANKGNRLGSLKQVASGGELSRIMLAIKSIMAKHSQLPTILFDEIDTGISGEVALKMGDILQRMSQNMQVISITHLPQIAAKGKEQMKVYKDTQNNVTQTGIKKLTPDERIYEIAEMLGGKKITETAHKHALQLLQLKK